MVRRAFCVVVIVMYVAVRGCRHLMEGHDVKGYVPESTLHNLLDKWFNEIDPV